MNTVVYVRQWLGETDQHVALITAVFGGCSMVAALSLPRLIDALSDRAVMLSGALVTSTGLALLAIAAPFVTGGWREVVLIVCWALIGLGYASILTPGGRLLKRSSDEEGRAAIFAAQFSLSHACWLVMYPLAGWLGTLQSPVWGALGMAAITLAAVMLAIRFWPAHDPETLGHKHTDLAVDHPHLQAHPVDAAGMHVHGYVINDEHPKWPRQG